MLAARTLAAGAALLLAVAAAPRLAAADGSYVTMGVGPGDVSDQLRQYTDTTVRIRLGFGHRVGNLAVEGFLAGDIFDDRMITEATSVGVDLKYLLPLSEHLQGYVRGSASRMSTRLGGDGYGYGAPDCYGCSSGRDYAGRGLGAGAGLQLRGKVRAIGFLYWPLFFVPAGPKVNAALYVDHGLDFYRLHPGDAGGPTVDAKLSRWTFGFHVGQDF